jgi:hypothetical protein
MSRAVLLGDGEWEQRGAVADGTLILRSLLPLLPAVRRPNAASKAADASSRSLRRDSGATSEGIIAVACWPITGKGGRDVLSMTFRASTEEERMQTPTSKAASVAVVRVLLLLFWLFRCIVVRSYDSILLFIAIIL